MTTDTALPTMDDREEFAALLQAHRGIAHKVAATYARHPDDRAELVQEIAAQLWRGFPSYDRHRSFSTWMYRVALNTSMAATRDRRFLERHIEAEDPLELDVAAGGPDPESSVLLAQVMASLDSASRALLLLHLEARSTTEMADILGVSPSVITTRLSRIRRRLRDQFA
jgi:RNA polymerase sigma-70 factor, ECF subfamily